MLHSHLHDAASKSAITPEITKGPLWTRDFEDKAYSDVATVEKQEYLIQSAADNPYSFSTLQECMAKISSYIFLPIEEEKYFRDLVGKLRDYEKKFYTYAKNGEGNNILKKAYNVNDVWDYLRTLINGHPLMYKYGKSYAGLLVWSWKNSKNEQSARKNTRKHLISRAEDRIWNSWKKTHIHGVKNPTKNTLLSNFTVPNTLDLPTTSTDLEKNPPKPTFLSPTKKKKKFNKKTLTSLFHKSGDTSVDKLLDDGREWIEDTSIYKNMKLKSNQILLRKLDEKNGYERPHQYAFIVKEFNPTFS